MSTCENEMSKDLEKLLFDFSSQQPYNNHLLSTNRINSAEYWKREKDALSSVFGDKRANIIIEWAKNSGDFERKCRMNITEDLIQDYFGSIIKDARKEEREKTIDEFVKCLFANEVIDKSVVRRVAEQMKE